MRERQLPRPRDVVGFAEATAAGLTPERPEVAPAIGSSLSAHQAFIRLAVTIGAAVTVWILALFLLPTPNNSITGMTAVILIVLFAIGYFAIRKAVRTFRSILLDELQAGYVTTTFAQGLFWIRKSGRLFTWADDVVGWDWDGLWVLDSDGNIVSSPNPSVDPPGLYPSPHVPGRRELWTGYVWTSVYFDN